MVVKEIEGFIKFPGIVPKVKMKGEEKKKKKNYVPVNNLPKYPN